MIQNFSILPMAIAFACAVGSAAAAQPGTLPAPAGSPQRAPVGQPAVVISAPGTLNGFKAATAEVMADQPIKFKFDGSGHCKLTVSGGDGYTRELEGQLPFSAGYTYGTGSMSSFDTFKDYSATVKPSGNCKLASALAPVSVRVNNPAPQGVPASGSQGSLNAPVMASTQLTVNGLKPAPATLTSLTLASPVTVGAPTVLVAVGTGSCKFRLTHALAETPLASQVIQTFSTTLQKPFPMTLKTIGQTPAGSYSWTANGIEGCTGSVKLDLAVS